MKRRGLRVALTAGAIGLAVVAVVVAFNWGVVRDHVEAWWFQLTTETQTVTEDPGFPMLGNGMDLLQVIADRLKRPVIYAANQRHLFDGWVVKIEPYSSAPGALSMLSIRGCRIIDQRFPRRAYVIVGYLPPPPSKQFLLQ